MSMLNVFTYMLFLRGRSPGESESLSLQATFQPDPAAAVFSAPLSMSFSLSPSL